MALVLAIIGVACVLYGVCVMMIWSGTWFFAVWYVLGAAFLAAAWALRSGAWGQLPLFGRRAIEIACVLALAVLVVCGGMSVSGFGQKGESGLDYVVVLGAQVFTDRPSMVVQYRLDTAYDYLQANKNTVCIVSGGQGYNEPRAEADVMADYLVARGVDESRIVREGTSLSTAENIDNSMKIIANPNARVGIVTNDFHVFRSVGIARKRGLANVCGIAAPSNRFYLPNNLLREALSIAKDYAVGNL